MPFGQFYELWGKPCHPIRMTSLYLKTVGAPYFLRAGVRRNFKNTPPLIPLRLLRGPLTLPLTLSLSLAHLLGLPPPLSLSFLFSLSLSLALLSFDPFSLGFSLSFSLSSTSVLAVAGASDQRTNG